VVDAAARHLITGGGLLIIASILAMMFFLVKETLPLWGRADLESVEARPGSLIGSNGPAPILGVNPFGEIVFAGAPEGQIVWTDVRPETSGGAVLADIPAGVVAAVPTDATCGEWLSVGADGALRLVRVDDGLSFAADGRSYAPTASIDSLSTLFTGTDSTAGSPRGISNKPVLAARRSDSGLSIATVYGGVTQVLDVRERTTPLGEVRRSVRTIELPVDDSDRVAALALDDGARHLYVGKRGGVLEVWKIDRDTVAPMLVSNLFDGVDITALSPLLGGTTIVVGSGAGAVESWFLARDNDSPVPQWVRSHIFDAHDRSVVGISPSNRDKGFVTWDLAGEVALHFATSGRTRARSTVSDGAITAALSPKANALLVSTATGEFSLIDVHNPHPEVTMGTLFGNVHYEGYLEPSYAWQSTGATDETEPKLSLIPLIFGTLKGTFYALFFSIPIAVLAAIYTALFMRPSLRAVVKPSMELMAAMPSVVLGLLAALWLAPRLQGVMPIFLIVPLYVCLLFVATGGVWRLLPSTFRDRVPDGFEAFLLVPVLIVGLAAIFQLNGVVDGWFDGGFLGWLFREHDIRYDQRNAIIVGLAMGLAVVPIIYSISEDALAAVPRHLTAGSLALGASPWQTAWRVVLPAASPGIFSAIMIGFGRAVGETMIVLMATGNTPIMDWSLFNGFRTLSANIAVEIPEAPHGGSLYRLLFLAALLLFAITFAVNTAAELVRHRLRQKYSRF
jgi:phosphate transport system permease protein